MERVFVWLQEVVQCGDGIWYEMDEIGWSAGVLYEIYVLPVSTSTAVTR